MSLKNTCTLILLLLLMKTVKSQQIEFEKDTVFFTRDKLDNIEKKIIVNMVPGGAVADSNIIVHFARIPASAAGIPDRTISAGGGSTSFYFKVEHGNKEETVKIAMNYFDGKNTLEDTLVIIIKAPVVPTPVPASPVAELAAAKDKPKSPGVDTISFNDNFSYNDTLIFNLNIIKYADKTTMKICTIPDTVKEACMSKTVLGDIKRETFVRFINEMLQSLVPLKTVDATKIEPQAEDEYVKYTSYLAKQQPKEPTENEKQLTLVNKKLEELFNEKSQQRKIGYFKLVNSEVPIHAKVVQKDGETLTGKIASVEIVLYNGAIRKNGLKVLLEDGRVFRNKYSPVTLYRLDKMKGEDLYVDDKREGKSGLSIELGDVINYVYHGKFSYPSDQVIYLSPEKQVDSLYVQSTIGELLDVNIFSDLLALVGRKANGIIQTQVTGTFLTNTNRFIKNSDLILNNFVKAYFKLSKYDSKFGQLDSSNNQRDKVDSVVNRLYLNQIAYLQAGAKANVFRVGLGNNQQFLLNIGAEISLTNADSIYNKDLVCISYYPELEYTVSRLDNFGLEASIKYLYQHAAKNSPFKNKERICIFNPQVTIYYYPFSNPNNKIYVRYAHYAQIGDGKYNYPQFQFGFKTNLFGKKEKSD